MRARLRYVDYKTLFSRRLRASSEHHVDVFKLVYLQMLRRVEEVMLKKLRNQLPRDHVTEQAVNTNYTDVVDSHDDHEYEHMQGNATLYPTSTLISLTCVRDGALCSIIQGTPPSSHN